MNNMNRREFVQTAALAGAGACGLTGCATFTKIGDTPPIESAAYKVELPGKVTVALSKAPSLAVGKAAKIIDPALSDPLIIARVEQDKYVVASLRCTHRGVELEYQAEQKRFCCASLGHSRFALDGHKLGGPAPRPIQVYPASVADGILTIKLQA
ncbi:MAG: Rieske 2Fe-2S domain-containing protein [Verrucomicrobia bacterium]|nr:Rieske 2Fe-2S domain-containing protein [Verrucomicrobiota bacterium]